MLYNCISTDSLDKKKTFLERHKLKGDSRTESLKWPTSKKMEYISKRCPTVFPTSGLA
jgi:hypothetical protein